MKSIKSNFTRGGNILKLFFVFVFIGTLGSNAFSQSSKGGETVANPMGIKTKYPAQLELSEYQSQTGKTMVFSENPLFADRVKNGELPAVEKRLPEEPLVVVPYVKIGKYGGTLRGLARAPESGTSEILSWRQTNLVRLAADMTTIRPEVAKSWKWNKDYTELSFTLRKGHKWSDGAPFTADDVVFYINDIILNKEINPDVPKLWMASGKPVSIQKVDDLNFVLKFGGPNPGFLTYVVSGGAYFANYAPKHYYVKYHASYNKNAEADAKADGFEGWVDRFTKIFHKWKDAEVLTKYGMTRPTLESHLLEELANTQRRKFVANPYYYKVDTAGQQLPYIDRHFERFLSKELQILAVTNGEVDLKLQGLNLAVFPVIKEAEKKAGYKVRTPKGGTGTHFAFNMTHKDPELAAIYSDIRFRLAVNYAMNREEIIDVTYQGLGRPMATVPLSTSFVTEANKSYKIEYNPDKSNKLLDEMGMKRGSDGFRTMPNGKPYTMVWEYSSQSAAEGTVRLMLDYFKAIGLKVNPKEVTSQASRQNSKAELAELTIGYDVPFEPALIGDIGTYIPPYDDIQPLLGVSWKVWINTNGQEGKEPPAWAKRLYEIAKIWKSVEPMSAQYAELGRELVKINQENMAIIGLTGDIPRVGMVSNKLVNVPEYHTVNFILGYLSPYNIDQVYFKN